MNRLKKVLALILGIFHIATMVCSIWTYSFVSVLHDSDC